MRLWGRTRAFVLLPLALLAVPVVAAPAHADPVLVGAAATEYARTDQDATAPTAPCEATAATPSELRALAAASGTAQVICLDPAFPSGESGEQDVPIQRDLILDVNGSVDVPDLASQVLQMRLDLAGDRHLQIRDTATVPGQLTVTGIHVPPSSSLVVWSGEVVSRAQPDAAIGGASGESGGTVVIRGGKVRAEAWGGEFDGGAGIGGGGQSGDGGSVTVWGGDVTAMSRGGSAIGGGFLGDGGSFTMHGGTVTATARDINCDTCASVPGAAIGGGLGGSGGVVTVTGGSLVAIAGDGLGGVGIGGSPWGSSSGSADGGAENYPGTVTISGGTVSATGTGVAIGGGTLPGGSLTIGSAAVVSVSAGPDNNPNYVMPIFGSPSLDTVTVAGKLELGHGKVVVAGSGDQGVRNFSITDTGTVTGPATVAGVSSGVLDNQGVITAPVDLTNLTVTGNNYRLTFGGAASDLRVFAPSVTAGERALPEVSGVAAWSSSSGMVEGATVLSGHVSSGSTATGDAVVALAAVTGSARLTLPATTGVGVSVTPVFDRVDSFGTPLPGDQSATYVVTAPGGTDATEEVVTDDGDLVFPTGGTWTVTATSAAEGFTHLSDTSQIEVGEAPSLMASTPPGATSGQPYSFGPEAHGYPSPTLSVDGELPPGLAVVDGLITGTPTRAGTYDVPVVATSSEGTASRTYRIVVAVGAPVALTLTEPAAPVIAGVRRELDVAVVDAYDQPVDVDGQWELSSSEPSDVVDGHGITFGTPGERILTARLIDDPELTDSATVQVSRLPAFGTAGPNPLKSGQRFDFEIPVTGSPAPGLTILGDLPPGLELHGGAITGVPTRAGTYPVSITAANAAGQVTHQYLLEVAVGDPISLALRLPSGAAARQGGSVTFEAVGVDAYGQRVGLGASEVVLSSSVATDVIRGLTVRFPHASPHVITARLRANAAVTGTVVVQVEAATPSSLPATGAPVLAPVLLGGLVALLVGGGLVREGTRRTRRP